MLCGYEGCGRYEGGHSLKHYLNSGHNFCISTLDKIIWSYQTDNFVHRVSEKTEIFRAPGLATDRHSRETEDLLEANVSALLCEQLDMMRKTFENEIEQKREELRRQLAENSNLQVQQLSEQKNGLAAQLQDFKAQLTLSRKKKVALEKEAESLKKQLEEEAVIGQNLESHIEFIERDEDELLKQLEEDIAKQASLLRDFEAKLESLYRASLD